MYTGGSGGDFRIGEIFRVLAELQGGCGRMRGLRPGEGASRTSMASSMADGQQLKLVLRAASCDAVLVEDAFDPDCGARLVAH